MRELVYYIATSVDGFIARKDGSFGDFPWDDEFGAYLLESFPETFPGHLRPGPVERSGNRRFDAVVMGRKTYEVGLSEGIISPYPTLDQYVFSTTLEKATDPSVQVLAEDPVERVARLKEEEGLPIWICGGGRLASTLFAGELVDRVIVKLNPIVLGDGIPMICGVIPTLRLRLVDTRPFPSGHVVLEYLVGD